jgi:hypothetical protein
MYPPPSSAYRPQVSQQPPQLIPQTMDRNPHPSSAPPSSSSSYPYPQPNYNSTSAASGQPPPYSQAMPYTMGGNTTGATYQQNTNLNGPASVRMNIYIHFIDYIIPCFLFQE